MLRGAFLALVLVSILAGPAFSRPAPAAKEWFVVNRAELPSLEGVTVYGICFSGRAPKALVKADLQPPQGHPLRSSGGVVIVHTLVNSRGLVVKGQILKGPDDPELRATVAECLSRWRFEPAVDARGRPAPVHFTLALKVPAG